MPQYAYRARNAQGGLVEGVLNCADRAVAIRQIEQQQCIPIKIDMVGGEPTVVRTLPRPRVNRPRKPCESRTASCSCLPSNSGICSRRG